MLLCREVCVSWEWEGRGWAWGRALGTAELLAQSSGVVNPGTNPLRTLCGNEVRAEPSVHPCVLQDRSLMGHSLLKGVPFSIN